MEAKKALLKGAMARLSFSRTRAPVSRRHCTAEAGRGEAGVLPQCPVTRPYCHSTRVLSAGRALSAYLCFCGLVSVCFP